MNSPNPRLKKIILSSVLLLLLVGAGVSYLFRSEIRAEYSKRKSQILVSKANVLIEEERWQEAFDTAMSAHLLYPPSHEALKAFFKTSKVVESRFRHRIAAALVVHPESSVQDKIDGLTLMHDDGDFRFTGLYNTLAEETRQLDDVLYLKGSFLAKMGALDQAIGLVENYLESGGTDDRFQLLKVALLLTPGLPEESRQEGQKLLAALIQRGDDSSKRALEILWTYPAKSIDSTFFPNNIGAFLDAIPGVSVRDRLAIAKVNLVRIEEKVEQEELIQKMVNAFRDEDPENLANWLGGLKTLGLGPRCSRRRKGNDFAGDV